MLLSRIWSRLPHSRAVQALLIFVLLLGGGASSCVVIANLARHAPSPPPTATPSPSPLPQLSVIPSPPSNDLPKTCRLASQAMNPVAAENTCPGTEGWRFDHKLGPSDAIEGFAAPISANAGETISIFTSTTSSAYAFQIFRLGWYGGHGARLLYQSPLISGIKQPPPVIDPVTHLVSCANWRLPVHLVIPPTWVSGLYIVKFISSAGYIRYTPFIVRSDTSRSDILGQVPILTYQAYNLWGGYDLYTGLDSQGHLTHANRAYVVGMDRPFSKHGGLGDLPQWDFDMVRWMERSGQDVSYSTDTDLELRGSLAEQHRLLLIIGHAEYWSTGMRQQAVAVRDHGVSLAFFGGNDMYWRVRLQSSPLGPAREIICYKEDFERDPLVAENPSNATNGWRAQPLDLPENAVMGAMFGGIVTTSAPLVLAQGAKRFLSNTHLKTGSMLPGLVGNEFDRIFPNGDTPLALTVIAASPVHCKPGYCPPAGMGIANATVYTASSGARVFDAGTLQWSWGLDNDRMDPSDRALPEHHYADAGFSILTANIIAYLLEPTAGRR